MESIFITLSQQFGLQTVIKAVIVCVIMMAVKRIKPNLSPKVELIIRLAVSILIHLLFTVITSGELLSLTEGSMSVCGVSMIFTAVTAKGCNKGEIKQSVSAFLPDLDAEKIDKIIGGCDGQEEIATEVIMQEKDQRHSVGD
ncbi:MAG: hypothetical protein IKA61_02915 [Clostridia bacterium]|nr:hypothetical protein [Clostridia bacterium]